MTMKYKLLTAAVASTIGFVGTAGAVNLSETGTGQVLIYPYYTVQDGNATLMSVQNTTNRAKAVKVRFRESLNSREVLDFNLYLSPQDIWTGAITSDVGGGAMLSTTDTSCTVPAIPAAGVPFRSLGYAGGGTLPADTGSSSIARTREGYFEVIEMGDVASVDIDPTAATVNFVTAVTHTGSGATRAPANCAAVVNAWASVVADGSDSSFIVNNDGVTLPIELAVPTGGIAGTASIINVNAGTDYSYDPVVLDNWADATAIGDALHQYPGNEAPTVGNALPVSNVLTNGNTVLTNAWLTGRDAVSSVLMRDRVMNEFTVEAALAAGTDFIVTFPTKNLYVPVGTPNNGIDNVTAPFQADREFNATGACQTVGLRPYDREELTPGGATGGVDFSPRPIGTPTENSLCWEVNVMTFNNTNVMSSANALNVPVTYENGWLDMTFTASRLLTSAASSTNGVADVAGDSFAGLPVVGFAVQEYVNGNVGGVLSNYGGTFSHKYETSITNN